MIKGFKNEGTGSGISRVFSDGGCAPVNPGGVGTYGFVVLRRSGRPRKIYEEGGIVGLDSSNNKAEYSSLIFALDFVITEYLKDPSLVSSEGVEFCLDSKLVVDQVNGDMRCLSSSLASMRDIVHNSLNVLPSTSVIWVARTKNARSDTLSRQAYRRFASDHPEVIARLKEQSWRSDEATPKQLSYLRAQGGTIYPDMTKGQASDQIAAIHLSHSNIERD